MKGILISIKQHYHPMLINSLFLQLHRITIYSSLNILLYLWFDTVEYQKIYILRFLQNCANKLYDEHKNGIQNNLMGTVIINIRSIFQSITIL